MTLTFRIAGFLLVYFLTVPFVLGGIELEKDPVKRTQTDPVPVTEELLKRESETGPASPSFKMKDTSTFMVEKPYEDQEQEELLDKTSDSETDFSAENWDDWWQS